MSEIKSLFHTHQACALTGFSKHMLDYLQREHIYVASGTSLRGKGNRRGYSYGDVVLLRALKSICDDVGKIRHLKKSLEIFKGRFWGLQPGKSPGEFLIAKRGVLYIKSGTSVEEAITGQQAFSFVVDMCAVTKSVDSKLVVVDNVLRLSDKAHQQAEKIRQRHWKPIKQKRELKQSQAI